MPEVFPLIDVAVSARVNAVGSRAGEEGAGGTGAGGTGGAGSTGGTGDRYAEWYGEAGSTLESGVGVGDSRPCRSLGSGDRRVGLVGRVLLQVPVFLASWRILPKTTIHIFLKKTQTTPSSTYHIRIACHVFHHMILPLHGKFGCHSNRTDKVTHLASPLRACLNPTMD